MALEQTAKTVHLVVRADLDRRGFRPKFVVVAQQYIDQRRFPALRGMRETAVSLQASDG
jgi:hypothetical protein